PNPSGKWVAYATNVWESLALPSRHPGDNCNALPEDRQHPSCREGDRDPDNDGPSGYTGPNGTSTAHGECPPQAGFIAGECFNNQLEWLDYYEDSMEEMLTDLGVVVHRYPFHSPGRSDMGTERGGYLDGAGGQAYNISATIPGADHPEQTVLVSGHFDFTDSGPAAAWDSAEGHTEVMRMAYIMADYYRKTGTRPSATLKFIPWDSEESGTFGSLDYVQNNIPPGEEDKVRGYFNVDPCAGAYPAYRRGNPALGRVPEVMQLADPDAFATQPEVKARIEAFNERAETVVDEVFNYLDDTLTVAPGVEEPIFVSDEEAEEDGPGGLESQRDEIVTAVGGLLIFSSDYANFSDVGIPIFNLFPDYFGPHADGTPGDNEGVAVLHTPRDNLRTINAMTNADQTGMTASEGWAKGMEMCSQIEAWYMLQPEMAGTQAADTDVVAYFEALPNEALVNQNVTFDARGTYQYANAATRSRVPQGELTYRWTFGDGTTANGRVVEHAFAEVGRYQAQLRVTGRGGSTDTMTIPVEVVPSDFGAPALNPIPNDEAKDGSFNLTWGFESSRDGFRRFSVQESRDYGTLFSDDAEGDIAETWNVELVSAEGDEAHRERTEPWQPSDSGTPKFRGNQAHSGQRSYWTGVSPPNFSPSPLRVNSLMTLKEPVSLPESGDPMLDFWSLYQNEGDEQGRIEVAVDDGDPSTEPVWETVKVVQPPPTFLGDPHEPKICQPSEPETFLEDFVHETANLKRYLGKDVLIRFNYALGPEDRLSSQPCGWYMDDIRVASGTFEQIGTTEAEEFAVQGRRNGTYAYRVLGVYNDGVRTAPSNVEVARVTEADVGPEKCPGHRNERGNHVVGTPRADTLRGTAGRDVICGLGGGDTIRGKRGRDLLIGGRGPDSMYGKRGNDELLGNRGND
ncbi:MAG TPA: M28 family peptidase, partial [Actinomycetota bacterium]|nr:M28 family peptidase [Actinomycetota bacterium]